MTDRDAKINELKKTSQAYQEWQKALELRDRIYKEVGSDNDAARRAVRLVKITHAVWMDEANAVDAVPSAGTMALLEAMEARVGVPQAAHPIEEDREPRKPPFRFSMVGIDPHSVLRFTEDSWITCTVVNDTQVNFRGRVTSLSGATREVMQERFNSQIESFRGPDYWMYLNERLTDLRNRLEEEAMQ